MQIKISDLKSYQLCEVNSLLIGVKDYEGKYWLYNPNNFEVNGIKSRGVSSWNPDTRYYVTVLKNN